MIKETLKHIEEQVGLKLTLCKHFSGVKEFNNQKYFNIVLNDHISESKVFDRLKNFADKYKTIKIEQNGWKRVAVFIVE